MTKNSFVVEVTFKLIGECIVSFWEERIESETAATRQTVVHSSQRNQT